MQKAFHLLICALAALSLSVPLDALARGSHHSSSSYHSSYHARSYGSHHGSGSHSSGHVRTHSHASSYHAASGVERDKHGRIKRSSSAKNEFKRSHPCPSTGKGSGACPGYVIDHVKALKHGGADAPGNMQWQTKEAAKAKDKWE